MKNTIKFFLAAYFLLCSSFSFAISGNWLDGLNNYYLSSDECISAVYESYRSHAGPNCIIANISPINCYSSANCNVSVSVQGCLHSSGGFGCVLFCPRNSSVDGQGGCKCSVGYHEVGNSCERNSRTISLSGGGTTALPCGDPVELTATVTEGGAPAAGVGVNITMDDGGAISGSTGADGTFRFLYVPPYLQATSVGLTGTCSGCDNQASSSVTVAACPIPLEPDPDPEPNDPPICRP